MGPNNRIEPGGPDQGQPTVFAPRRGWGVFTIVVPKDFGTKNLTWTIVANGETASVPFGLNPQYEVSPFREICDGQYAADAEVLGEGPDLTVRRAALPRPTRQPRPSRPPSSCGRPTKVTSRAAAAAAVPASRCRFTSSEVPERSSSAAIGRAPAADGKVSTTAAFSAPGEYIVRVQANDSSGDGGGGFQCCWTNAHVKVTVK